MTIRTDRNAYSGTQPITIIGLISPAPGPGTAAVVAVRNPAGIVVDIEDDLVNSTSGGFSQITVPGGSTEWINGIYVVNATWGGRDTVLSKVVTFNYSSFPSTMTMKASTSPATPSASTAVTVALITTLTITAQGGPVDMTGYLLAGIFAALALAMGVLYWRKRAPPSADLQGNRDRHDSSDPTR